MSRQHSRFRTAVHALAVIAYVPERQATSEQIAASVATDATVVRKLLATLREQGLVRAVEGRGGGYALARAAGAIRLGQIFDAVSAEGLFPLPERLPNADCPVGANIHRVLDAPLAEAAAALVRQLDETTLEDVLTRIARSPRKKSA